MADRLSNQDVATKNYVDKNVITTNGSVAYGDIKLSVGSDLVRSLSCNDITTGKKFTNSAGDRYKCAMVFLTRFRITSACQDKN